MKLQKDDLVSVIIPVYNTEKYLDECLESVINQTYKNLEIILIDDGSTDNSAKVCQKWADKDKRILFFTKENEGLGPTRNFGVDRSTGKWIAFLDSDDWWDREYVTILHDAATQGDAEVVDCNYCMIYEKGGGRKETNDFQSLGIELPHKLKYAYCMIGVTRRLIKSSLFKTYVIEQPAIRSEDGAVGLLISVLAKKIVSVNDVLYYYRKERDGAITSKNNSDRYEDVLAMHYLVNGFKKNSIYDKYYDVLKLSVAIFFSRVLISAWIQNYCLYDKLKRDYVDFMQKTFKYECQVMRMHIGSWNLMSAIRLLPHIQDINMSFQFSSLISIVSKNDFQLCEEHSNPMRRRMVKRDITAEFWTILEKESPDYLIMDFIEERHDILKISDGYITKSDALDKCIYNSDGVRVIHQGTEEWFSLWEKSCDEFVERVGKYLDTRKIIVVKNYLADRFGDVNQVTMYDNQKWIQEKNRVLEKCYTYMEKKYPMINYIDISEDEYYFTDAKYEYGVEPWYLNTLVNDKLAKRIETVI